MPLQAGDKATVFTLLDQPGEAFSLSRSLEQRMTWHLVSFYPTADMPGCTTQTCGLRDVASDAGDTVIIGISQDTPAALARFDAGHGLGLRLLSDVDHEVAEAYGAWGEKITHGKTYQGVIRSAFLVDEAGALAEVWPKISPKDTPRNLLKALAA